MLTINKETSIWIRYKDFQQKIVQERSIREVISIYIFRLSEWDTITDGADKLSLECIGLIGLFKMPECNPLLSQFALLAEYSVILLCDFLAPTVRTVVILFSPQHETFNVHKMLALSFEEGSFLQADAALFFCEELEMSLFPYSNLGSSRRSYD